MYLLNKKRINNYLLIGLIVAILFFVGISIYLVKDFTGGTCGTSHNNALDSTETSFSGLVVTNNDYYLQEITFDPKELPYYEEYKYCLRSSVIADTFLELQVLDEDHVVLGNSYFSNTTGTDQCVSFTLEDKDFFPKKNFLGFRCVNCDGISNNLTVYDANNQVMTLSSDGFVLIDKFDVDVVGVLNCQYISFRFFKFMLLFLFLISIIFLMDFLFLKGKEIAFDGWE